MTHHEKHDKNETVECERIPVSDIKGIVETIKNELSTVAVSKIQDVNCESNSQHPPRIPDLSIDDKQKILGLVNMLGKMNQDKEKYCEQVANYCNEVKSFQLKMIHIKEMHQHEKLNLNTQIEELKEKQGAEFGEFTLYKTRKEIEISKLCSEYIQEIQNLQNDYQNKLDNQKTTYDTEINQMRNQISEQKNLMKIQANDHASIENSSKLMIEQLKTENSALKNRVDVYRSKLKSAFYALKKIKRKLDHKPIFCSRSVQTM